MSDLISRQAAIDALDIAIERYDEIAEKYRKKADIERNDYMDMRDNAYEAQQLAQWLNELKYLREKNRTNHHQARTAVDSRDGEAAEER